MSKEKKFRFTVKGGDVEELSATSQKSAVSRFVGAIKRSGKPNPELTEIEEFGFDSKSIPVWKSVWKPHQ